MKRNNRWIALSAALLLLLSACSAPKAPQLNASVKAQFDTAEVLRGDVSLMNVYSAGISMEFEPACAAISGTVQQLHTQLGAVVKQGELLAQIGTEYLQERLETLQTQLTQLRSRYEQQLSSAQAQLKILQLQKSQNGADTQLLALEEEKTEARITYLTGCRDEQVQQLERAIAQAEQAVADSYVYAPCDGTVASVDTRIGWRTENGAELFRIAKTGSEYLLCTEGGASLALTKGECWMQLADQLYEVELIEYTDEDFTAALLAGNVPARFRLPEDLDAAVGDSAQLRVIELRAEDVLYLPRGAMYERGGRSGYVYRIVDGEKVYTEVTYEFQTDSWVVITSGLEEGEVVYVPQSS